MRISQLLSALSIPALVQGSIYMDVFSIRESVVLWRYGKLRQVVIKISSKDEVLTLASYRVHKVTFRRLRDDAAAAAEADREDDAPSYIIADDAKHTHQARSILLRIWIRPANDFVLNAKYVASCTLIANPGQLNSSVQEISARFFRATVIDDRENSLMKAHGPLFPYHIFGLPFDTNVNEDFRHFFNFATKFKSPPRSLQTFYSGVNLDAQAISFAFNAWKLDQVLEIKKSVIFLPLPKQGHKTAETRAGLRRYKPLLYYAPYVYSPFQKADGFWILIILEIPKKRFLIFDPVPLPSLDEYAPMVDSLVQVLDKDIDVPRIQSARNNVHRMIHTNIPADIQAHDTGLYVLAMAISLARNQIQMDFAFDKVEYETAMPDFQVDFEKEFRLNVFNKLMTVCKDNWDRYSSNSCLDVLKYA